jgi:hypothetical protein
MDESESGLTLPPLIIIPITRAVPLPFLTRDFVPWRFSDRDHPHDAVAGVRKPVQKRTTQLRLGARTRPQQSARPPARVRALDDPVIAEFVSYFDVQFLR